MNEIATPKMLWLDLETTGTNHAKHGIHQIAGMVEINGEIKEKFDIKLKPNPKALIDQGALDAGKVTMEQINTYQSFYSGYMELHTILGRYVDKFNKNDKFHLAGYNTQAFDGQFLRGLFLQNDDNYYGSFFWNASIDVMLIAAWRLKYARPFMKDFKLMTVAKHMGVEVDESKLHDAFYDIDITKQLYHRIDSEMNPYNL